MGLLTEKGRQRYALATGKHFIGICDRKGCGRLIGANELYTVVKSEPRKDGLTFLGAKPTKIMCPHCQLEKHPIPKKKEKVDKGSKKLVSFVTRLFEKHPKNKYTTKMLVLKVQHRKKFANSKHREIVKALKILKKNKVLQYKEKFWSKRKIKKAESV